MKRKENALPRVPIKIPYANSFTHRESWLAHTMHTTLTTSKVLCHIVKKCKSLIFICLVHFFLSHFIFFFLVLCTFLKSNLNVINFHQRCHQHITLSFHNSLRCCRSFFFLACRMHADTEYASFNVHLLLGRWGLIHQTPRRSGMQYFFFQKCCSVLSAVCLK